MARFAQRVVPALCATVLVAAVAVTGLAALWPRDDGSMRCTNKLVVIPDNANPPNPEALAAARVALHSITIQRLGSATDYKAAASAKIFQVTVNGATKLV